MAGRRSRHRPCLRRGEELWYWIPVLWLLFFVIFQQGKKQRIAAVAHHIKNRKKEAEAMEALAKQFTGKECIIYTINSNDGSIAGIIREVSGSGMLIEDARGQLQAVNLEYVTRIREYPRNKKGKKESVILD
jgi:hypothetical protein